MTQRVLKCRAWDKKLNRWIKSDSFLVSPQYGGVMPWASNGLAGFADKDCVLMQFTGLHDKNGVEIYEGDIVEDRVGRCLVRFTDCAFYALLNPNGMNEAFNLNEYEWQVIGNIYENPELLEAK